MIRTKRIEGELELLRESELYDIEEREVKGVVDLGKWVVWVPGRAGTVYQGATFPITITLPQNYPREAPIITFPSDFRHVHVYEGGAICMPIVDQDYWKPTRTMQQIISRFDSFLHQKPNLLSPANEQMLNLLMQEPQKYEQQMKAQADKYREKSEDYFKEPAVHIHYRIDKE